MSALSLRSRLGLRSIALFYLAALLIVPVGMIFYRTFEHGLSQPIDAVTSCGRPARLLADDRLRRDRGARSTPSSA